MLQYGHMKEEKELSMLKREHYFFADRWIKQGTGQTGYGKSMTHLEKSACPVTPASCPCDPSLSEWRVERSEVRTFSAKLPLHLYFAFATRRFLYP